MRLDIVLFFQLVSIFFATEQLENIDVNNLNNGHTLILTRKDRFQLKLTNIWNNMQA